MFFLIKNYEFSAPCEQKINIIPLGVRRYINLNAVFNSKLLLHSNFVGSYSSFVLYKLQ